MQNDGIKKEQELYDNYEDALFRLAMSQVAEEEGKLLMENMEQLDSSEYLPSKELDARLLKLIDRELKKKKDENARKHTHLALKRSLMVIAAVFMLFSISLLTVSAFRLQVFNFMLGIKDKYTSFQLQDNSSSQSSSQMFADWENAYMPTYLPDGYSVGDFNNNNHSKSILLTNKQDDNLDIIYSEYDTSTNLEMDTENASVLKSILINGNMGTLIVKDKFVTVVWAMDNRMFTVSGQADEQLILAVAESVKYVE
ncbi:MAG: DUF4367 domain-containing protein [Lawsonibacter sp.]|nr:DUF4367 domain-containing protein [Lawsonibacter sp.]